MDSTTTDGRHASGRTGDPVNGLATVVGRVQRLGCERAIQRVGARCDRVIPIPVDWRPGLVSAPPLLASSAPVPPPLAQATRQPSPYTRPPPRSRRLAAARA